MTSDNIDYMELIPDYLSGILDSKTRSRFENALLNDPELRKELEDFRELQSLYRESLPGTPQASEELFDRIMTTIESEEQGRYREITYAPSFFARLQEIWHRFRKSLTIPWGLALIQAAVLVILLVPHLPENSFNTLSTNQAAEENMVSLNIVFEESSPESKIRELLLSVNATITSGPSAQGRYQVTIPADNVSESTIDDLRKSKLVRFVEKAY